MTYSPRGKRPYGPFRKSRYKDAVAEGILFYFTGRPCTKGHYSPRFTSNRGCWDCLNDYSRNYARRHKADFKQYKKHRNTENPVPNREQSSRWVHNNPIKARVMRVNDKAQRRGAIGVISIEDWHNLMSRCEGRCERCGVEESDSTKLTVDHIIPISVGGPNDFANIQILCVRCNTSKGARTVDYRYGLNREGAA